MRKMFVFTLSALLSLSLVACSEKKEEPVIPRTGMATPQPTMPPAQQAEQKAQLPEGHPSLDKGAPMGGSPHGGAMQKSDKKVVVPDAVKKSWSKVRLQFIDKTNGAKKEIVAPLGKEVAVEGTQLKIKVGEFLPEFTMAGGEITSRSNEPKQPAVRVEIFEQGKLIHKGWLFAKMPEVHALEHPKYGLLLKEGLK